MKNSKIYHFKSSFSNNMMKIKETIKEEVGTSNLECDFQIDFEKTQIRRFYNFETHRYDFCVVLSDTHKSQNDVLICPLEFKTEYNRNGCVSLGLLPLIDYNKEIVANIFRITFINKKLFNYDDLIYSRDPFGRLNILSYKNIMQIYYNIINEIQLKSYNLIKPEFIC